MSQAHQQDPEGGRSNTEGKSFAQDGDAQKHPQYQRGLQLYRESERSGFQKVDSLTEGLQEIVDAAEDGVEDAVSWIRSFFASKPAVVLKLPEGLEKQVRLIAESAENEEQIKMAAKAMFAQMVGSGRDKKIPKSKIDEYVKMLVASESGRVGPEAAKWEQQTAESRPRRMVHSDSDERVETLTSEETGVEERQQVMAASEPQVTARRRIAASEPRAGSSEREVVDERQERTTEGQQQSVKRLMYSALKLSASDEITEEAFIKAAIALAMGEQVAAQEVTELSSQDLDDFEKADILTKVYRYPLQALKFLKRTSLTAIEKYSVRWLKSIIPAKQIYILLIAYILPMLTVDFVVNTIAFVLLVVAIGVMSVATLEMFLDLEKISSFEEYSSVFQIFNPSSRKIDTKASGERFAKRSIGPYFAFIIALPLALITLGMAHQQLVSYEILSIVAVTFTIAILLEFEFYNSPVLRISLGARLLGLWYVSLPLVRHWVPEFLFIGVTQTVSIPVFPGIYMTVNLMMLVQLFVQLVVIAYLLTQTTWNNFYTRLGPFALFNCWWILSRNFLSHSHLTQFAITAMYVVILVILGVVSVLIVCLLLSLSFTPLLLMASPIIGFLFLGFSQRLFMFLSVVVVVNVLALYVGGKISFLKGKKWHNVPLQYVCLVPIFISVLLFMIGYSTARGPPLSAITVPEYAKYCGPQNHDNGNMIQTQLNCFHLEGRTFEARGTIQSVKIVKVKKSGKGSLSSLGSSIQAAFLGLFGGNCGIRENKTVCSDEGRSLQPGNEYHFEVEMPLSEDKSDVPISVTLIAPNRFEPIVMKAKAGMEFRFNSTFIAGMGSDKLTLRLTSATMGEEFYEDLEDQVKKHLLSRMSSSVKEVLFFLLEIFLGYPSPTLLHK